MTHPLQTLNPSFKILAARKELAQAEQLYSAALAEGRLLTSCSKIDGRPVMILMAVSYGALLWLQWRDRSKTILHLSLPLQRSHGWPQFADYSTRTTPHDDHLVRFAGVAKEVVVDKKVRREVDPSALDIVLCKRDSPGEVLEQFALRWTAGGLKVDHRGALVERAKESQGSDEIDLSKFVISTDKADEGDEFDPLSE